MMSKEALDPPEPPANPRVVNYDKTYVELQWWAPDKSDIKHYIIEMQETFLVPKDAAMPEEAEGKAGDSDHGQSLYWTAKSSFLCLASDHTEADQNFL